MKIKEIIFFFVIIGVAWIFLNLVATEIMILTNGSYLGEKEFWPAFYTMTKADLFFLLVSAICVAGIALVIKSFENKDDENKYSGNNR